MGGAAERAMEAIRGRAAPGCLDALGIDVHFHPDATTLDGRPVLGAVADARRWRTQFETGTSNGGLTAHAGGDRWRWESRLFSGAYDDAPAEERPAYGGLRRHEDPYGSAPRFGSAHLNLREDVLARTTLAYPDSTFDPDAIGTTSAAGAVLAALEEVRPGDPLDRYVEAHVHGGVRLEDVEALVLDPSHRGTAVETAALALGPAVRWHPGYRLTAAGLVGTEAYRGTRITAAALDVLVDGALTPAVLGAARAAGALDADTAKRVWHLLARFGATVGRAGRAAPVS